MVLKLTLKDNLACVAEDGCSDVFCGASVCGRDVMEKIASSGTEEHTTHYYTTIC